MGCIFVVVVVVVVVDDDDDDDAGCCCHGDFCRPSYPSIIIIFNMNLIDMNPILIIASFEKKKQKSKFDETIKVIQ